MITEALEHIEENRRPTVEVIDDLPYSHLKLYRINPPIPLPLELHTLRGLVDWISDGTDIDGQHCLIHVANPDTVNVIGTLRPNTLGRFIFARANNTCRCKFPFGRFIDPESFTIAVLAGFVQDDATAALLRVAGNVRSEGIRTDVDDGVTQHVAVRKGAKFETQPVKNPVSLCPWSTFPEVDQPCRQYVFRLRPAKDDDPPTMALFGTDDMHWWIESVENISQWLTGAGAGLPIIV